MEKIKVVICTGTACFVMGGSELLTLDDHLPEMYADRVQIEGTGCLDYCKDIEKGKSPFVVVNGHVISEANIPKVIDYITRLFEKE